MSDFLKDPKFEPNDQVKNFIESLFADNLPKDTSKEHRSSFKLEIPDAPPMTEAEIKLALKIVQDEFAAYKREFMEFQDKVSDMGIYSYLFPSLDDFGDACQDLLDLIENNFDKKKFTDAGEEKHKEAMKIRANILAVIYNKYRNSGEGN